TGNPTEVADEMIAIIDGADIDGFMLEPTFGDEQAYAEFIEMVLPILTARGYVTPRPAKATLRERIFVNDQPRLPASHPGARFRHTAGGDS
ncbi:MAG: hypothetical protein JWQ43_3326, partial [Glaciihabitans sp.]|nr:hypothetical protein [Glaciihabitans sp.]